MRIWKIEIMTTKGLRRRLRLKQKSGWRNAMAEIAHTEKVLYGNQAFLKDCEINGKIVLMGDEALIVSNHISHSDIGLKVC